MTEHAIQMSAPDLNSDDASAVSQVLESGTLGLGPRAIEFESKLADLAGVGHAIAVSSGTSALHLIVRALRLSPGDRVLVPSFTFAASVNAFLLEGAAPRFLDIDADTFNVSPDHLRAERSGAIAMMVVDVFGHPAAWDEIRSSGGDLPLIDDCCEAIGAEFEGRPLGGFGVAGAFGFYPNKQMTTGEGGVIVTDDEDLARVCRSLRNQGRAEMGGWLEHERLGFNYRMDEMSAALGVSQLARLDTFLDKRERVAATYTELLSSYDWVRTPIVRPNVKMSWFVYVVLLAEGIDRDEVMRRLDAKGVPSRAYFSPLHLQPYIRERFGTREGMLPVTESIAKRTLALPFHNNLPREQAEYVVATLAEAVENL